MPSNQWTLKGTYFETCNCDLACPCVFLSAPTDGECTVLVAWHIERGHFENVDLSGLNAALAAYSPGHMTQVPWKAALYLDDRASQEQRERLTRIFGGQAGGHPARLATHIGEVLGVKSASIQYEAQGRLRSLRIGDIAEAEIEGIEGQGGADVTVTNHPLCIAPGHPAVAARSRRLEFHDHEIDLSISDKNGFYSPFSYQGS